MGAHKASSQQTRFLFIARKFPVPVEAYDKNQVCIFWNDAAVAISGYPAGEVEGNPDALPLLYPDVKLRNQMLQQFQVRGYDFKSSDWVLTCKDGQKRTLTWFNISKFFQPVPEWANWAIGLDNTPRLAAEAALQERNQELLLNAQRLTETNTALKVLLETRLEEKKLLQENFMMTLEKMIQPFLERLKQTRLLSNQEALVDIIANNISQIAAPFSRNLSHLRRKLTPGEFEVAVLVSQGRTNYEIADLLNISPYTASAHRNNIRRKLGLIKKGVNLRSHLQSALLDDN